MFSNDLPSPPSTSSVAPQSVEEYSQAALPKVPSILTKEAIENHYYFVFHLCDALGLEITGLDRPNSYFSAVGRERSKTVLEFSITCRPLEKQNWETIGQNIFKVPLPKFEDLPQKGFTLTLLPNTESFVLEQGLITHDALQSGTRVSDLVFEIEGKPFCAILKSAAEFNQNVADSISLARRRSYEQSDYNPEVLIRNYQPHLRDTLKNGGMSGACLLEQSVIEERVAALLDTSAEFLIEKWAARASSPLHTARASLLRIHHYLRNGSDREKAKAMHKIWCLMGSPGR